MPRWNELPDSLDERVRQLTIQLRRIKDHSGLGLASLQSKTGYSRSSWERYLNGKALPPRQAVEELARIVGADPTRLLVLHQVAEEALQKQGASTARDAGTPAADGETAARVSAVGHFDAGGVPGTAEGGPDVPGKRSVARATPGVRRSVAVVAVVVAALAGLGAGLLAAGPLDWDDGADAQAQSELGSPQPSKSRSGTPTERPEHYRVELGKTYPCDVYRSSTLGDGLTAGYSKTRTQYLASPSWDVVEAQCLLDYHRLDPGPVDGVYGQQTMAAVAQLQKKAGLVADGIVGPDTWSVLRR